MRRWVVPCLVAAALGLIAPAVDASGATTITFPQATWVDTFGSVALSSPVVATIDGVTAVVFASENGYVDVVDASDGMNLPGWPEPVSIANGVTSPVESTPTVAYLDGPKKPPTIIVGAGSTYLSDTQGGLIAFNADGSVRFRFSTKDVFNEWHDTGKPDGYDEGVFATPAIGDVEGNGRPDIVFGAWDHRLYALRKDGSLVPGFPIDTQDTIWSSPSLFHVRGKKRQVDIFTGGDASGRDGCHGGFIYDITYDVTKHAPRIVWQQCKNQTIWSSPAVGTLTEGGRPVVVVGTGFGEPPPYKSDSYKLFAVYARTGTDVPGWPVKTAGPAFGSPAIGQLVPGGPMVVVDTSWCQSCAGAPAQGASMLYEWSASGQVLWSTQLLGPQDFSSPVLADLTGTGVNDVLVGSSAGLYPIDGGTGQFLYGTSESSAINNCSMQNAPAVAYVPGSGSGTGWRIFETCGGPSTLIPTGRLFSFPMPATPAVAPPWPQWREGPSHDGVLVDPS